MRVLVARTAALMRDGGAASLLLGVVVLGAAMAGRAPIVAALALGLVVAALGFATMAMGRRKVGSHGAVLATLERRTGAFHVRAAVATGRIVVVIAVSAVVIELARGSLKATPWAELGAVAALAYLLVLLWMARRAP